MTRPPRFRTAVSFAAARAAMIDTLGEDAVIAEAGATLACWGGQGWIGRFGQ